MEVLKVSDSTVIECKDTELLQMLSPASILSENKVPSSDKEGD